ncbi:MAG: CBS domain-containing protein [Nitrospinales bacterium]
MKLITTHLNADFDALASMVAAQKLFPSAKMVFSGSTEKYIQEYLNVTRPPLEFTPLKEVDLNAVTELIIVDTHEPERIGPFKSLLNKKGVTVQIFDHHPERVDNLSTPKKIIEKRGSCATLMCEILMKKKIGLSPWEATLMALGIYEDTHSLTSPSSTPEDFMAMSQLIEMGADLNSVTDFVEPKLNQEQLGVMNDLIFNLELHNFNGIEFGLATATADKYVGDLASVVSQILKLENLNALFALIRLDDRVYLIARSRFEKIDTAKIAREFSGGGHAHAASACVRELTLVQVREKLLALLSSELDSQNLVGDLMHFPVVTIEKSNSVESAEKLMARFNLNNLPVMLKEKPVGLVTRQVVQKAIHHGLAREPIEDIMVSEFKVTSPSTWVNNIIPIIVEEKQKLIPVVDQESGTLVGVISRGDILRFMGQDKNVSSANETARNLEGKKRSSKKMKSLMTERLPRKTMDMLLTIGNIAEGMNIRVYVVGGFVRDLLLQVENLDIDVVAEGDGQLFAKELGNQLKGTVRNHEQFGTSVVSLKDGTKIDVATARIEYYQSPAALPTVEMGSIKSDLFRRDFSLNSLAIILNGKNSFNLIDYFNGERDLKEKTVRVLHNLSFVEDPCRMLRAIRFEQRLKFSLGKQTEAFLKNAVKKSLIDQLSGHRFFNEIMAILKEKKPLESIRRMDELDLLKFIHPNLFRNPDELELLNKVDESLSLCKLFPNTNQPEEWKVYLLALLFNLNEADFIQATNRFSFSEKLQKQYANDLSTCRMTLKQLKEKQEFLPSEIFDLLSGMSAEAILLLSAISNSELTNKLILLYFSKYVPSSVPTLTGEDLIRMGIKPGPVFKTVLKSLSSARINGMVKTRDDEIALVKKDYLSK